MQTSGKERVRKAAAVFFRTKISGRRCIRRRDRRQAVLHTLLALWTQYLSLAVLIRLIGRGKFWVFGAYCLMLGLLASCLL